MFPTGNTQKVYALWMDKQFVVFLGNRVLFGNVLMNELYKNIHTYKDNTEQKPDIKVYTNSIPSV